jgi:hypothetical protein
VAGGLQQPLLCLVERPLPVADQAVPGELAACLAAIGAELGDDAPVQLLELLPGI